jgi:hypothetical protein
MRRTSSMGDVAARVAMGWLALWVFSPTENGRAWRKVTVGKPISSSTSKFCGRKGKITNELFRRSWGQVDVVDKMGEVQI